jgi:hypothetical protein
MAGIRFSFIPESNKLSIELASSDTEIILYGKQIRRLEAAKIEYDLKSSLVNALKGMQEELSQRLRVYYPGGRTETFDEAVLSLINGLGTSQNLDDILIKKAYARYYYDMFKNKMISVQEKDSDALIMTGLVSYYFMKRLVHVFVMCTIYQKVSVPSSTTSVTGTTPIIINETSGDFTAERNIYEAKLLALQSAIKNSETSSDASIEKVNEINALNNELLNRAEQKIKALEQQVNNYRELLLKSTTMIFKLDEIPNVILGAK